MNEVLKVYKKIGETPLEVIERLKDENPFYKDVKMTYAGRLDPMAEGLLLILAGDAVHQKEEYNALDKVYEFEVLFGASTDTGDVLGLVDSCEDFSFQRNEFLDAIKSLEGVRNQKYPMYSSKTVNGVPLWKMARDGDDVVEVPEHEVNIKNIKLLKEDNVTGEQVLLSVEGRVPLVKGDFRQKEIIESWKSHVLPEMSFMTVLCETTVSSGTYIRVLADEIGEALGTSTIAYSIKRIRVGNIEL